MALDGGEVARFAKIVRTIIRREASAEAGMSATRFETLFDPAAGRMTVGFGLEDRPGRSRRVQKLVASLEGVQLPRRILKLPRDRRGYPVPRFVQFMKDGEPVGRSAPGAEPDFRIADHHYRAHAWRTKSCWVCGELLGTFRVYAIGPMCVVNRTTSEPACHRDCAEFSAKACPFLVRPKMRRLPTDDIPDARSDGYGLQRNPGVVCLYQTGSAKAFPDGRGGWLIRLGDPTRVDWWCEGRQATRDEVLGSIGSGYPLLLDLAQQQGPAAVAELERLLNQAMRLVPA